ncbi:jg1403 [Pararge aegeria aegeria]|uniref:Jg1403 protein n=1 Tax=Pararge aegeria aegeria TaxID=348720 RepID=A0A8S4RHT0_9NEOP|nr:jg1403 [Pararge aegeria aegeria]
MGHRGLVQFTLGHGFGDLYLKRFTSNFLVALLARLAWALGKMEAGRAFQILAVRIRNEDAKRFVRVRGISTT